MSLVLSRNYLPADRVEQLARAFEATTDWNRMEDRGQEYALKYPEFKGVPNMPQEGERYWTSFDSSNALMDNPLVRLVVSELHGNCHRCYRMGSGQGLRLHNDSYFGYSGTNTAHNLYLNRRWCWDWGGLLHVMADNGATCEVVCPEFNSLASVSYSNSASFHFVSQVAEWACQPRYVLAVFGARV